MRYLKIDGVIIPLRAGLEITQDYGHEDAEEVYRMGDGSLRWQQYGDDAIEVTVQARGIVPPAFESKGFFHVPRTISCIKAQSLEDHTPGNPTNQFTLPANRRTDAGSEPIGRAYIGNRIVRSACNLVGNLATVDPVVGATGYAALWFPEFVAKITLGRVSHVKGGTYSWTLTAREVTP